MEMQQVLADVLAALELERLEGLLFRGNPGEGRYRLFGGLVAAQSVVAAGSTVEAERRLHSLHAYFLRPGRHGAPIELAVDPIRDGGSFSTRRVKATQDGEAIFSLAASFALEEEGIEHQEASMPVVPGPDGLPDRELERQKSYPAGRVPRMDNAVEVRLCEPEVVLPGVTMPARQHHWIRPRGPVPDEPLLQEAMLVYASDRSLLSTAALPHAMEWDQRVAASLDHALWLHDRPNMNQWHLAACESPVARSARGWILGELYQPDGRRVATVCQEALVRRRRPKS